MSIFVKFFSLSFKESYSYRFNFYITMISSFMLLFVQISVWNALYSNDWPNNGVDLNGMITYVILSSVLFQLNRFDAPKKIGKRIEDGSIISDFLRPVNFKNYILADDVGNNIFRMCFFALPPALLYSVTYGFSINTELSNLIVAFVSVLFGVLIAFYIKYIIGLFAFWLETAWYIPFLIGALFDLFSGSVIPIWFYPQIMKTLSNCLPFRLTFYEPISIFLGRYPILHTVQLICIQITWLIALYLLERLVWRQVKNKVVVHGG